MHSHWADKGLQVAVDLGGAEDGQAACLGARRMGGLTVSSGAMSVWLQIRGRAWVESREGTLTLRRGDWLILERDSAPTVQTDAHGLCLGLTLDERTIESLDRLTGQFLYAGRGRASHADLRAAVRLWRTAARRDDAQGLRPLMMHLAGVQKDLAARMQRCPGRSRSRKRQVFGRMQRARLYLEGHSDRVVRIGELAKLTNFSSWYFSKAFQSLYDESPQALSVRLRLERAARLLRETPMMVGEVAAASGFENCCSFARAFRAHFGVSATRYRAIASKFSSPTVDAAGAARKVNIR